MYDIPKGINKVDARAMLQINRLEIKGISAQNLSLGLGQCISLSGASGMGKSLFLKGVADLVVNRGELFLEGMSRSDMTAPEWRQLVTYVPSNPSWWEDTVAAHFHDKDWLTQIAGELDLASRIVGSPVSRLSTGEAQRVSLLRALQGTTKENPRYFLLDEPTSALDGGRQTMVEDLLNRYLKAGLIGVIFVSHDERQVERFAHKHWQIYNRRVQEVAL